MSGEEEERQKLLRDMYKRFDTLEQVRAVRARVCDWLRKHPDDDEVLGIGESLVMLENAFMQIERKR